VALVILDPMLSVLGDTINDHRAKDVRAALEPLVAAADRTDCLMVAIAHFNKGNGIDAATLLSGSHAFRDLPRAVFAFAAPQTEKVFTQVKNNLGRNDLPSLTYTIEPVTVPTPKGDAEVSKFVLGSVSHRDVADLLSEVTDGDDADLRSARTRVPALLPHVQQPRSTRQRSHRSRSHEWLHPRPNQKSPTPDARPKSAQPQSRVRHGLGMASRNIQRLKMLACARVNTGTFVTAPKMPQNPQGAQGARDLSLFTRGGTFTRHPRHPMAPSTKQLPRARPMKVTNQCDR
jgi:hypothetical protein